MMIIAVVGGLLYFCLPRVLTVIKKIFTMILVATVLIVLYMINGGDWGGVALSLVDVTVSVVDWLADQFVSLWYSLISLLSD